MPAGSQRGDCLLGVRAIAGRTKAERAGRYQDEERRLTELLKSAIKRKGAIETLPDAGLQGHGQSAALRPHHPATHSWNSSPSA